MKALGKGLLTAASAVGGVLASAKLWCLALCLAGIVGIVGGAFVLAGLGWAMVAGGAICLAAGVLVLIGLARG